MSLPRSAGLFTSVCAELADSVGLFTGNAVTRRGVQIGTVRNVEAAAGVALVTFDVDADQRLPLDAQATSIPPSIIAVRQLAILGDDLGGATLPSGKCITREHTATPASISDALHVNSVRLRLEMRLIRYREVLKHLNMVTSLNSSPAFFRTLQFPSWKFAPSSSTTILGRVQGSGLVILNLGREIRDDRPNRVAC